MKASSKGSKLISKIDTGFSKAYYFKTSGCKIPITYFFNF